MYTRISLLSCLLVVAACGSVEGDPGLSDLTYLSFDAPGNTVGGCGSIDGTTTLVYADNHCLDIGNGGQLVINACNDAVTQQWQVADGVVRSFDGRCATYDGQWSGAATHLAPCGGSGQSFQRVGQTVQAPNNLCLDVLWNMPTDGNTVQIYACNGTTAQSWAAVFTDAGGGNGNALTSIAREGNRCIDVGDGGQLVQRGCNGAATQSWLVSAGTLQSNDGRCVTVDWQGDGAMAHLGGCQSGSQSQVFNRTGNTFVSSGGFCLDVQWASPDDGAPIQVWSCNGTGAQAWTVAASGGGGGNTGGGNTGGGNTGGGSSGLTRAAIIADMLTPLPANSVALPSPTGWADGQHAIITQCVPRNDAIASWGRQWPDGTTWPFQYPWIVVALGNGHQDNGSWNLEIADFDFQVFLRSTQSWIRPNGYPARAAGMVEWGLGGVSRAATHFQSGELSETYKVPNFNEFTANPMIHNGVGDGYVASGDGTDVYSIFISSRMRLTPSGNGAFDPSQARVIIQLGQDIYTFAPHAPGVQPSNGNSPPGKFATADWQYFTMTLFRDDAMNLSFPSNPAVCDDMPRQSWVESHLPMGVSP